MTNAKAVLAVALIATLAACSGRNPNIPSNAQDVPITQLGPQQPQGQPNPGYYSTSGFKDSVRLVIRDDRAWSDAWDILAQPSLGSMGPAPEIDFNQEMVLLAAMGEKNHGGYSIALDDAAATADAFYVSVTETSPGANTINCF